MNINTYIISLFTGLCITTYAQEIKKDTIKANIIVKDSVKHIHLSEVNITYFRRPKIGTVKLKQTQLAKRMISDIYDLVRYTPSLGVSSSGSRGGTRGFTMRGVEANRVAISVDGIQQPEIHENLIFSAYGLSNASRIEFDPYLVSSINIQKGSSSFMSGSGALGGVVNYKTKRVSDLVGYNNKIGATLQLNYNGKNNLKMGLAGIGIKKKKWEGLIMFTNRYGNQTNNFEYGKLNRNVTSTRLDPMTFKQQTLLAKVKLIPNTTHNIEFSYYMINKRINSEIWTQEPLDIFTTSDKPYYYAKDQSLSHSYSLTYTYVPKNNWLDKTTIVTNVQNSYLDAQTWSEYYRPNFYDNGSYKLIYEGRRDKYRGQEIKDKIIKTNIDFIDIDLSNWGNHKFSFTGTIAKKYNKSRNVDVENPIASNEIDGYTVRMGTSYKFGESIGKFINTYSFQRPIDRINYSTSLMDMIKFYGVNIALGIRYDFFNTIDKDWDFNNDTYYMDNMMRNLKGIEFNNSKISDNDKGFSYLATLNYQIFDYLNIGYKFSTGFRVPTTEEKYFQYFNSWPSFLVLSNKKLKSEISKNHEIEISGNKNYFSFSLNFYRTDYNHFIDVERGTIEVINPLDNSVKNISYIKNVNRKSAKLYGFDAKAFLQLDKISRYTKGLTASVALSYAKGTTSYGTGMLSAQPFTYLTGLEYTSANKKWNVNLKISYFNAKNREGTKFIESTVKKEVQRTFPSSFLNNAYSFDVFGYYKISSKITIRAGVYNIFNKKYWQWDDLRQLTNPSLLPNIESFFREGINTITRFSQPKRYFNVSLEFNV